MEKQITTARIFAVLCLLMAGNYVALSEQSNKGTGQPMNPLQGNEPTPGIELSPRQAAKKSLDELVGDSVLRMSEYENAIAKQCARLGDDIIEGKDVTVVVKTFETGALSGRLETLDISDHKEDSNIQVDIPLQKIRDTPEGKAITKLTVVVARWKNQLNLTKAASYNTEIPYNGTAVTVTYFRGGFVNSLPVSYTVNLENDFTEIKELTSNERLRGVDRKCAWLDLSTGNWNTDGCTTTKSNGKIVKCECEHTTTFVTLLTIDKYIVTSPEVFNISLAFEIVSICCLFFTISFIWVAKQGTGIDSNFTAKATGMSANRTNSQVSLCVSLLCLHFVIVWSDFARNNDDNACVATTTLTHFFLLASGFWSLCEGVGIFIKVFPGMTLNVEYRTMTIVQTAIGWMVPLIIAVTCVIYGSIHTGTYMDVANAYEAMQIKMSGQINPLITTPKYEQCWLGSNSGMIWAALGPLILVVSINIAILVYVTVSVVKMSKGVRTYQLRESRFGNRLTVPLDDTAHVEENRTSNASSDSIVPSDIIIIRNRHVKHMVSVTRSFAILMPILAVPWLLAILGNIPGTSEVFLTAHMIINGLQGLQLFLLYCVVNKKDWKIVKRKWKNSGLKFLISNYRHRRDSVATQSSRVVSYGSRQKYSNTDANGNAYLNVGLKNGGVNTQYDTLSSCRSSSGTINSAQSLQRGSTPPICNAEAHHQ